MGSNKVVATQVSLPKGGGAIHGIGETFQPDEFSGTAGLSTPIDTTFCRGFEPQLRVGYNSGNGNGPFGLGFALSIPKISRKTSKGLPKYDDTDTFILSNADDLVPMNHNNPTTLENYIIYAYRPRTEGLFAKIEQWLDNSTKESYWRVTNRDNITSIFGKTPQARISDPEDENRIFEWLLEESFDARGNYIIYRYKQENIEGVSKEIYEANRTQTANKYIEKIQYGNEGPLQEGDDLSTVLWHFEVIFDYGEYNVDPTNPTPITPVNQWASRPDPFSSYHAGFEIRTHRLCRNVLMFHRFAKLGKEPVLVRATRFHYKENPNITFLTSVEAIGYRYEKGKYQTKSLPPLEFQYTEFQPEGHEFEPFLGEESQFLPGLISSGYQILDLYGEGIPGVLYNDGSTTLYWEPAANDEETKVVKYHPPQQPQSLPLPYGKTNNQQLIDLTGNGKLDLVLSSPNVSGYYEVKSDRSWQRFQTFPAFTNEFLDPDSQLTDITGDGLLDLLRLEGDRVKVYPGKGKAGFGMPLIQHPEHDLPLEKKGDRTEALRFADIFGTGRQHLVRIRNGAVECWPSLGYGKFGKKVTLGNAPSFGEDFDVSRLFLADIDGSGTADILYVKSDRVLIWFNQSGNYFSKPLTIYLPSPWDSLDQIRFADVFGNGTTCMVFSESHPQPRQWCYDFCQGQKPYLLNQTDNNMGAVSEITYASSTQYYLQDKRNGMPWVTSLPFPVQVVAKVETRDRISNTRLVSTYTYHHGYYDGVEREFCGFGMVERQDTETLEDFLQSASDAAKRYYVPPVLTKTWYHVGAWELEAPLMQQYRQEYFPGDSQAHLLPGPVLDWGKWEPTPEESRLAYFALKKTVLREEVYGLDGSALANNPYSVEETNFTVKLLQPQGKNKYAVFFVHELETLAYHYERHPRDPRVQQDFVLEITEFGNVKKSCTVVYGRRAIEDSTLVYPEQTALKATVQLAEFIEETTDFRLIGIPYEQKTLEVNGLDLQGQQYFTLAGIQPQVDAALNNQIAYGVEFSPNTRQARLFSWEQSYFWNQTQDTVLPLGQITAQALMHHHQQAVFSDRWRQTVYGNKLDQTIISHQGGYFLENGYWWNKGLVQHYLKSEGFYLAHQTANNFAKAANQADGLQAKTTVTYDSYYLVPVKTEAYITDTEKNVTTAAMDYQTLTPWQLTDINQVIHQVRFDPLGMVIATSIFKKASGGISRTGDGDLLNYQVRTDASFEGVLANPADYLQDATTFFYYNLFAWQDNQQPASYISLTRQTHVSDLQPGEQSVIQVSVGYSDGFGRVVEEKQLVEPGVAILWDAEGNLQRDGNGQLVQGETDNRWLVSGRTVYNNKGKVAEKYLPYFSNTALYESQQEIVTEKLVPPPTVMLYDPLLREIRIDTPKGFFSKVEFTAWETKHYDENDTVKDSTYYQDFIAQYPATPTEAQKNEKNALDKAAAFDNTPSLVVLDSLGHPFLEIQNNLGAVSADRFKAIVANSSITSTEVWNVLINKGYLTADANSLGWLTHKFQPYTKGFKAIFIRDLGNKYQPFAEDILNLLKQNCLTSYHQHDIQGREIESIDPRLYYSHIAKETAYYNFKYQYAMGEYGKTPVATDSADAGLNLNLDNIFGNLLWNLSPRNYEQVIDYDRLQRKLKIRVKGIKNDGTVATNNLVETFTYGETQPQPENHNLRGKVYQLQDQSGVIVNSNYSFQGELLETTRTFTQDYKGYINWDEQVNLEKDEQGHEISYQTQFSFNAIQQLLSETTPDGSVTRNTYNQEGLLDKVAVKFKDGASQPIINHIEYNANRQRTEIAYESGVKTNYTYEDTTLHLIKLYSTRPGKDKTGKDRQTVIQDIAYTYDPVGNITRTYDKTYETVFYNNQKVEPLSDYTYDALYRLIKANGRQHPGINAGTHKNNDKDGDFKQSKFVPLSDSNALEAYRESYTYDDAGNLLKTTHTATNSWTRTQEIMPDSNRLKSVSSQNGFTDSLDITYDRAGNQQQLNGNSTVKLTFNCFENLVKAGIIERSNQPDDSHYYTYDSGEMRTRKVSERLVNGSAVIQKESKIYLGNYEVKRLQNQTQTGETTILKRQTLRVMDDKTCVAIIHYWEKDDLQREVDKAGSRKFRYQLDNHLDSVSLEVDGDAQIISYEEYFPYGGTAFIAGKNQKEVKLKEYRYSGKERDDATGLYYYGARYYAPWLGRWINPDPAGRIDGQNIYAFVRENPETYKDPTGYASQSSKKRKGNNVYSMPPKKTRTKASTKAQNPPEKISNSDLRKKLKNDRRKYNRIYWQGENRDGIPLHLIKGVRHGWSTSHDSRRKALAGNLAKKVTGHGGLAASENSHIWFLQGGGSMDYLAAPEASTSQNGEMEQIEQALRHLKQDFPDHDIRSRLTGFVVPFDGRPIDGVKEGALAYVRIRVSVGPSSHGDKANQVFDHISIGQRHVLSPEHATDVANELYQAVATADSSTTPPSAVVNKTPRYSTDNPYFSGVGSAKTNQSYAKHKGRTHSGSKVLDNGVSLNTRAGYKY